MFALVKSWHFCTDMKAPSWLTRSKSDTKEFWASPIFFYSWASGFTEALCLRLHWCRRSSSLSCCCGCKWCHHPKWHKGFLHHSWAIFTSFWNRNFILSAQWHFLTLGSICDLDNLNDHFRKIVNFGLLDWRGSRCFGWYHDIRLQEKLCILDSWKLPHYFQGTRH